MRAIPRRAAAAGVLALALASPLRAAASAFEVLGFGPAGVAEVNARAARATDGTAAFYNPAGLGFGRGARVELAPMLGVSALEAQGEALALESPFGFAFAFDATVPFTGLLEDRVRFGFGGYFLPDSALRVISRSGDAPFYPYYDNRTQRLVAIPALAVRLSRGLSIGGGANVLAGVAGPADVRVGASGAPESRIDEEVTTILTANLGVRWDPADHVRLAFAFRQRFAIRTAVTTTAEVGGVPLEIDVDARQALYDPDCFVLASSFDLGRASFELDATYSLWSSYEGPYVDVHAELPGVNISSKLPEPFWRDVISLRGAGTYRLDVGDRSSLTGRLGLGFEPTILQSVRQGRTNLADGDKVMVGLGATLELTEVLPRTLRVGLGGSAQLVSAYEQTKRACSRLPCPAHTVPGPDGADPGANIDNPGYPTLSASGSVWAASLGLGVDL